ncbi:MAG: hypothetical protein ISR96_07265 [Nitrospira sp.]|nr:hypothetical protein [bacterium]MBL7049295.1 hypothetical protein [Nitrospira sp.]
MSENLVELIELQAIDSLIIELAGRIGAIPRKIETFRIPMQEAHAAFEKFKASSETFTKKKKDRERELDDIQDKITKLKSRSSDIKTNKEYDAHLREIEGFEKRIIAVEDEILEIMESLESFDDDVAKEEVTVKVTETEFNTQEKVIQAEQAALAKELAEMKAKRASYVAGLEESIYSRYMILLKKLGGLAVVEVKNQICLGCHRNIPPQLFSDIKKNDKIYQCFHCNRFLYVKPPEAQPETSPSEGTTEA